MMAQKIADLLAMFPVVAVVGARQCGKSTLVRNLRPDWRYYDLESPDDYRLISNDPVAFFATHDGNLVLDEVQQYPDLFKTLRGVIDADRRRKGRFILTGSSSPELVRGTSESLAGRIATVELWPFKQCEHHDQPLPALYSLLAATRKIESAAFEQLQPVVSLEQSMRCWLRGGFPEPCLGGEDRPEFHRLWQENYIADYLGRDLRQLFPRLNIHNFHRFLTLLAQFSGHQLNMSVMARALEIGVSTVKDYLDIIHQTFLWRNLAAYTRNPLKKVQKARKGFFRDQGLLHHLLRIDDLDQLLLHPVAGFSFESFVCEELIRGLQATMATQLEFTHYRTVDKAEVDLIIEGPFGVLPVEIKLGSTVNARSLRGLKNLIADQGTPCGLLVNRGKRVEHLGDGIVQVPVNYL